MLSSCMILTPVFRVRRPSDVGLRSAGRAGLPSPQVVSGRVNWSLMMLIDSLNCTRFSTRTVVLSAQHPQWLGPSRAETVSFPVQSSMSRGECDKSDKLDILHNVCNILPFFHTTNNNQHDAIRLRNVVISECWILTKYILLKPSNLTVIKKRVWWTINKVFRILIWTLSYLRSQWTSLIV